jgi:uncharacterized YccA/Bax inhibitor family protein
MYSYIYNKQVFVGCNHFLLKDFVLYGIMLGLCVITIAMIMLLRDF